MITKINNASDAMDALSENFELLTTGKRKPDLAREVTNNIGKMINLVKTQIVEKVRTGDSEPIQWLKSSDHIDVNALIEKQKERESKPLEFDNKKAAS